MGESLKKTNKNSQHKYEEKLREAEKAISSLENELRAQVGLQKEEKKAGEEKSVRISELEQRCQELEKNLEDAKKQVTDAHNKLNDPDAKEAITKAEERVVDLEEKLNGVNEAYDGLIGEKTGVEKQIKTLIEE